MNQCKHRKCSLLTRVPFTLAFRPPSPKPAVDGSIPTPEATAGFLSRLTFAWMTPLLSLGYSRPLSVSDLYKLQEEREAAVIAHRITLSLQRRTKAAQEFNDRLARGDIMPGFRRVWWKLRGNMTERERRWREVDAKRSASLTMAMNDSVKWWFWTGGILKLAGDTAQIISVLVIKAMVNFVAKCSTRHSNGEPIPSIRAGVILAMGLFALQVFGLLCTHHAFYRATTTGVLIRGGLIAAIYSRSLRLTARARSTLTDGKLINYISTDVSRIDYCAGSVHVAWTAPIQVLLCSILLILNLGPSAIPGLFLLCLTIPFQSYISKTLTKYRHKSMHWTDKRAKLLQELFGGMRILKYFVWEIPLLSRIAEYRKNEMKYIRSILLIRAANNAVATCMPLLASVITLIMYASNGHTLEPAVIFSSLSIFMLLKIPLTLLPPAFGALADATSAQDRLRDIFEAELLDETNIRDDDITGAIEVKDASFTWDSPPIKVTAAAKREGYDSSSSKKDEVTQCVQQGVDVFKVKNISIIIPRGQLVAIVGSVGSGKSSLLQGIVGEMRKTGGSVTFGGSVAYCPQVAWVQNATIRENICFGKPYDNEKYRNAIQISCLEADINELPNGDLTEVGEKGISLSGGQKQRLNICRAIYSDTEIQIFDDPLSALDAHVGEAVFQNVFQNTSSGKTRILATHALNFLPHVDYIYTIFAGSIAEQGTYTELMDRGGAFSKFVNEYGPQEEGDSKEKETAIVDEQDTATPGNVQGVTGPKIMQAEERNIGAISSRVHKEYALAGKGKVMLPLLVLSHVLAQAATVMASYWTWSRPDGFYMGLYAFLNFAQASTILLTDVLFALFSYLASQQLHRTAIKRVMYAPISFFETTPLGRIMNRFSKDIDTVDNLLGDSMRLYAGMISSVLGGIILISIVLPWFLLGACFIVIGCYYLAVFYRSSATEIKRLDAVLRSFVYGHFSESLSGIATIRAYGETERFERNNENHIDVENRAYWLSIANQRWLGVRLDILSSLLTLGVSLLTVELGRRLTISSSEAGLVLSCILGLHQSFARAIRFNAEFQNNMTSVERIVHYATAIEQEAPHEIADSRPLSTWPTHGQVELKNIVLHYRPELPAVLKGISMTVHAGEKIGIIGRTGAGKSSIMTAMYRLVELTSGSILIDGLDISHIGLQDLRKGLAIIPQDPILFSGTLRSNLDPFGLHDDATLWNALQRVHLLGPVPSKSLAAIGENGSTSAYISGNPFSLDSVIEDGGSNLSIGQRSLVSLARALVKDSKIIIMDEATASVDYETDRRVQDTIAHEFRYRTILCIAHRLRTIISYDKICVLGAGKVVEFDTPERLFDLSGGIFRRMCGRSSISLEDIRRAKSKRP